MANITNKQDVDIAAPIAVVLSAKRATQREAPFWRKANALSKCEIQTESVLLPNH